MPTKDDKRWFIRPHHLESLTNHYHSVKDDVLNTRYFSHYNKHHGKTPQITDNEKALSDIELQLQQLKMKQHVILTNRGIDPAQEEDKR